MQLYSNEIERVIENNIKPNLKLVYEMRTKGLKDRHIASALGLTLRQFQLALENYEELKEVYQDATILLCSKLREVAINRALGIDGKTDKDGIPVGPDANLAVRLLEKMDPSFSDKKTVEVNITVEDVVRKLNAKRREEIEEVERIENKYDGNGPS